MNPKPPEPVEPATLAGLYAQAKADLIALPQGCLLRWSFWHARAVGRLEVARYGLKRVEQAEWEASNRIAISWPSQTHMRAAEERRPGAAMLKNAEAMVVEAAAYVEASRWVIELLRSK